jgi:glycerol-3-phosphate dehydrogenase
VIPYDQCVPLKELIYMKRIDTEVIVVGGGATGTAILRDLSLRGIGAVLVEKEDIAYGTTGRNHGLLHSGARYAVKDLESAKECISENKILKKIASHCIEDTGGLFVTLPDDDPDYHNKLLDYCGYAGIPCEAVRTRDALKIEPNLNPKILSAIRVPDATIDPFRLASANMLAAKENGASVYNHSEVINIIKNGDIVIGVRCHDRIGGSYFEIYGNIVINASGAWGGYVCELAGINLKMLPSKGSMIIIDYRINSIVINRCRMPSDGDIIVPGDTVSIIGTTSRELDYLNIDRLEVGDDEIDVLIADGAKLIPNVSRARILRAYCGVRPLVAVSGDVQGRDVSRGIVLIDHEERDSAGGIITIAGGKLMTCRLMAEMAVDLASKKIKKFRKCTTQNTPLPGSEKKVSPVKAFREFAGISKSLVDSTLYRQGQRVYNVLKKDKKNYGLVCECEMVAEGEIEYALIKLDCRNLVDLRRRTRLGMGPCQGALCSYRAAGIMAEGGFAAPDTATDMLVDFLEERWKGIRPVLWGDALRELEFTYWIYQGLLGMGEILKKEPSEE